MNWLKAKLKSQGVAEVWINRTIGTDSLPDWFNEDDGAVNARMFVDTLESLGELDEITVYLNCNGGDVYAGLAITNYLRAHKATVHMVVMGVAASIASVILTAGDTRKMGIGAQVMTHNPASWLGGFYTAEELREKAELIDSVGAAVIDAYVIGTGKTAEEIKALLDRGDTYMGAKEAIEWGFATEEVEGIQAVACDNPPQALKAQFELSGQLRAKGVEITAQAQQIETLTAELAVFKSPPVPEAQAVITACTTAGFEALAVAMISEQLPQPQIDARLVMAGAVADICAAADLDAAPVMADIKDPVAMMRTLVTNAKASQDADIDNHLKPRLSAAKQPDSQAVYNQLNNVPGGQ